MTLEQVHLDTGVLVDGFLEDVESIRDEAKRARVVASREFFRIYDGPALHTSSFVLSEFLRVATHPNLAFRLTPPEAKDLVRETMREQAIELVVE